MNFKIITPKFKTRININPSQVLDPTSGDKTQEVFKGVVNELKQETSEARGIRYRLGCLEVSPRSSESTTEGLTNKKVRTGTRMLTPACLYYCQAANLIPHLLPDVASTLSNSSYQPLKNSSNSSMVSKEGVELETKKFKKEPSEIETCPGIHHTSIDQFINLPGYKDLPYSFSEFTGTESQLTLMDVHDPASRYYYKPEAIKPWKTGWAFATLATAQGLLKVTAGAYAEKVASFKMDIAVCLYDCMPNVATKVSKTGALSPPESKLELPSRPRVVKSLEKTYNWTEVCTLAPSVSGTSLISAVVGGPYADLRVQSAKLALGLGDKISGYLVANLHGEEEEKLDQLRQSIDVLQPELLASPKPVFSWEFITPREVLLAVENGVDVFDSTYPYLAAEHGYALTFELSGEYHTNSVAMINLNRPTSNHSSVFQDDLTPISKRCSCYSCSNEFSRAYVVHLLNTHEMLAKTLLMCHNLQVYLNFFDSIRATIDNGTFENQKRLFLERHVDVDWFEFLNAELTIPSSQKDAASGLD